MESDEEQILKKIKIYVAGPYTPKSDDVHDAARIAHLNTRKAILAGIEVIKKGHLPFIPHLTHYLHLETQEPLTKEFYYNYSMEWLTLCDGLLYLGSSSGADLELKFAKDHGLSIYYSINDIPEYRKK